MQKKLQSYHFIIWPSLIYVLTCTIISVAFFSTWDADYGTTYSAAMYLSDTKRLYVDLFAHKGPAYFAFIQIFGKLFGWGEYKIIIPYFFAILILLTSNLFLLKSLEIKKKFFIFFSILFIGVFSFQNANASLIYFQFANIFLFISFFCLFLRNEKFYYLILALVFFSISFLTKVDALLFYSIFILVFFKFRKQFYFYSIIFYSIIILLVPILIYYLFSQFYDFTIKDFFDHNFVFQKIYMDNYTDFPILSMFHRPALFKIVFSSGIGLYFLLQIFSSKLNINKKKIKNIFNFITSNKIKLENLLLLLSSLFIILIWLYAKLDGESPHYAVNIQIGLYLLSLLLYRTSESFKKSIFLPAITLVAISFMLTYLKPSLKFIENINCVKEITCQNLIDKRITISELKSFDSAVIIDATGYEYVLSRTSPAISINNSHFFLVELADYSFLTSYKKGVEKILSREKLTIWLRKIKLETSKKIFNDKFSKKINVIEDQGYYLKVELVAK